MRCIHLALTKFTDINEVMHLNSTSSQFPFFLIDLCSRPAKSCSWTFDNLRCGPTTHPKKQTFRSFDQFSNMVLDDACERKLHFDVSDGVTYYADIPLGLYIVRGDSVVLLGQIGDDGDGTSDEVHPLMKMIDLDELEGKIASASSNKNKASSSPEGVDNGHVLEWDFDKDLLA